MMVLSLWVDGTREKIYPVRNDKNASADPKSYHCPTTLKYLPVASRLI